MPTHDGINVALKSTSENPGGGQFGIEPSSHDHLLQINGGYVVVYAPLATVSIPMEI